MAKKEDKPKVEKKVEKKSVNEKGEPYVCEELGNKK